MSLIVTRAPFRISFAGGGTDLPSFYEKEAGAVLSTTISKYVYVIIKRRDPLFGKGVHLNCSPMGNVSTESPFEHRIRVSYSQTENVDHAGEIRHPIVRESLKLLKIEDPIEISTSADVPAGTGLGSSSTFAVALLQALHEFKEESATPNQLMEEAFHIEVDLLKRPMGKQDHCAAAFGGLNRFTFLSDGSVKGCTLDKDGILMRQLFPYLMLFYTGIHRDSSSILSEQRDNTREKYDQLLQMREHVFQLEKVVSNGFNPASVGVILHESWMLKQSLASGISNVSINQWYERAMKGGAWGGKICGAGGGGFLLLVVDRSKQEKVRQFLSDLPEMQIGYEPKGSQTLISER